jgi:hypothetical protein
VLDTHSPLVCLSIAPLYGLRYSPASCQLPPSDIQDKPPTVQVGHYGRPTVTRYLESHRYVTDLQGPPSERTPEQKLWDFKTRAQQYARDRESCDDTRISYMEFLETEAEDDLALARMIAG